MKSVLRSCLDPLPRFLTLRGLSLLVAMLVLGVVFSVWEFVESGQLPAHRVLANDSSWSAPRAAPASCASNGSSTICTPCPAASHAPATIETHPAEPTPPSMFDPSRAASGG